VVNRDVIAADRRASSCVGPASLGGCQCYITLSPPPNRPDPATYSQVPLLTAGDTVTWASPDVSTYAPPTYDGAQWQFDQSWFSRNQAVVTLRNRSNSVPAINTGVALYGSGVGIGLSRQLIATQLVSLAAGEVRQLTIPLPGFGYEILDSPVGWHTGWALFVEITHPYDADTENNHGEYVSWLVSRPRLGPSQAVLIPDTLPIHLGNTTDSPRDYVLSILPNSVSAQVQPLQLTVAPGSIQDALFTFDRPSNYGSTSVTVIARDLGGNLLGGVTLQLYFS
jgi:hypothetical protein